MRLNVYERRGKWFWRLFDQHDTLVAKSPHGYRSFALCRDYARFTAEGIAACL